MSASFASNERLEKLNARLQEIQIAIKAFKVTIPSEIKVSNPSAFPTTREVRVNNLKDIKFPEQKEVDLSKLEDLRKELSEIKTEIRNFKFPTSAKNPIAVQLSDGAKFYKAIDQYLVNSGGGGGSQPSFQTDNGDPHRATVIQTSNGKYAVVVINPDGTPIGSSSGTDDVNVTQWGGVATSLGQKAMAASVPVVIASDQSTLTIQATDLDTRNLVFATDKVDISGSTLGANSGVDIGDVDVLTEVSSTFDHGSNRDVDTTAEQITTSSITAKFGVLVKAANANTGTIYVGNSDVTAGTTDATDGFEIGAGESVLIKVDNANKVYAIASAINQIVYWMTV